MKGERKMANEKRLIDANELDSKLDALAKKYAAQGRFEAAEDYSFVQTVLLSAQTVDAVEVVHGRWEDMWDGKYANPRYRCSVCKEKANYRSVQDELLSWHDVQVLTPYCPYCIAKLDGGIDNDIKAISEMVQR
jgi:hypothetical protein